MQMSRRCPSQPARLRRRLASAGFCASASLATLLLGGCNTYVRDDGAMRMAADGQFGAARERVLARATTDPKDRSFMLDRAKLVVLALADGVPEATEVGVDRLYDGLRTQGLNDDKTVASFVFGESGVRIYKGEPFEQAMGYCYVAIFDGLRGDWGNVRAAANNALFLLRDFSSALQARGVATTEGEPPTTDQVLAAASKSNKPDSLGIDYRPVASDFELGYVLKAVAARQLGLVDETREVCAQLRQVAPRLADFAGFIESGQYNTVLVVDAGLGPRKVGRGPDNAIADFVPVTPSSDAPLQVTVAGSTGNYPVITDLNRLSRDVRWKNLEDLRQAKSAVGTALQIGGVAVAASSRDRGAQLGGLIAAIAGTAMRASAAADTRHNELLPQRVYVALFNVTSSGQQVAMTIREGQTQSLVLSDFPVPDSARAQLRYVRMPVNPAAWAQSGTILYSNDSSGPVAGPQLPWILGGHCVRTPSLEVMREYHAAGLPASIGVGQMLDLYKEESIIVADSALESDFGRHILEGGRSLYSPLAGSTGFQRLFGVDHGPYQPKSRRVLELAGQLRPPSGPRPPPALQALQF